MQQYWTRFISWLQQNASHLLKLINQGATSSDIEKLEKILNAKLPDDFVEFYKIHNGQNDKISRKWLIDCKELLTIDDIILQWKCWKQLLDEGTFEDNSSSQDDGVKDVWWNPLWVPFTYDGDGNHLCLDLDPAPNGSFGQVIRMWHDHENRTIIASSFSGFISDYKYLHNKNRC